jgi:hypothetical protein
MTGKPNLFSFATTELSQDAFLCWLLSWGAANPESPVEEQLHTCAKQFLMYLYNLEREDKLPVENLKKINLIQRQYKKIDVYVHAVIGDKEVSFIIEDKTHTSYHSDQLIRYKKEIQEDSIKEHEIVGIYYKTGYLFERDHKVTDYGYKIVDCQMMYDFLSTHSISHPIYSDYKNYLFEEYCLHFATALQNLEQREDYSQFMHNFVQYEYMKKLSYLLPFKEEDAAFTTGSNRDGTPFTLYRFMKYRVEEKNEQLFYRLDKRYMKESDGVKRVGFYLSLRQYSPVKEHPAYRKTKITRLKELKKCWRSAEDQMKGLVFSPPLTDRSGRNESEIAVLFFDGSCNSPSNVLQLLPLYHQAFIKKVEEQRAVLA